MLENVSGLLEDQSIADSEANQREAVALGEARAVRDVNSKDIFGNARLMSQFLKDYSGLSLFDDVEPDDIEDVTERYRLLLGIELENDAIKKVRVRIRGQEEVREVYILSLIEHKSQVDYDVAMQILRYMVVIWQDYARKQNEQKEGATTRKSFRYPLIIPMVYYEGSRNWTADRNLSSRIECSELAEQYVPDFTYRLISLRDYTSQELTRNENEMSLVMMINRIQKPEDYTKFLKENQDFVSSIYGNAPEDIQKLIQRVLWSLLMKMNVPVEEASGLIHEMEAGRMGVLFENMEPMDIQKERANTQRERKNRIAAQEAEKRERKRADAAEARADNEQQRADNAENRIAELEAELARLKG